MLISIDDFYSVDYYNTCKEALLNNGVPFKEYVSITGNNKWYLDVPSAPIMVNYVVCPKSEERYLVNKVCALEPSSEYRYYRKIDGYKRLALNYIRNDAWSSLDGKSAWLVKIDSKEQVLKWSQIDRETKIWYLGKYFGNRYRFALITSSLLRSLIPRENILAEKTSSMSVEMFETEINYKVLYLKERIFKFSETPYFKNDRFYMPQRYPEEYKSRFFVF